MRPNSTYCVNVKGLNMDKLKPRPDFGFGGSDTGRIAPSGLDVGIKSSERVDLALWIWPNGNG